MQRIPFSSRSRHARPLGRGLLLGTMGLVALGCAEDPVAPTGPAASARPDRAVTVATTYAIKDLGTLGGQYSAAKAINNMGSIVGSSTTAAGAYHAFLYRVGLMRDLGALGGGQSTALAINDSGVVVGSSTVLSGASRAVRWKDGVKKNLGTLGGRNSEATGINLSGVIVGWSETASGQRHAFMWKNGVMTDLGTLAGGVSRANGINVYGRIVGSSADASGNYHAVAWKDGVLKDFGTDGQMSAGAGAINDYGQIVGSVGPPLDAVGGELEMSSPFLFYQGTWTVFGTSQVSSDARAISAGGIIVGFDADYRDDYASENAWVRENGAVQRLPELSDGNSGTYGINRYGTIVGYSETPAGQSHAVLWRRQ
jgi:probable HAF family extracellular repeat protein